MIFREISLIPTFAEPAICFPVATRLLRGGLLDGAIIAAHRSPIMAARSILEARIVGAEPIIKAVTTDGA